jgi:hypothetical protein
MVRNIISNQDVEDIISNTVGIIDSFLHKYGAPHIDPVFVGEHVYKASGSGPLRYQDELIYEIVYKDGVKLNDTATIQKVTIVIEGTSDNEPSRYIKAEVVRKPTGKDKFLGTWKLSNMAEFRTMLKEMMDNSVSEPSYSLPHLLFFRRID